MRRFSPILLILAFLGACAHQAEPPRVSTARHLEPAVLPRISEFSGKELRTLTVRVWADRDHRRVVSAWQLRAHERITLASGVLAERFGLKLEIEHARAWEHDSGNTTVQTMIDELTAHDSGEGVDLVIGLVGPMEGTSASIHALGAAKVLGKHLVLRPAGGTAAFDQLERQLEGVGADERDRLHRLRKRHEEAAVLLHELGHIFGALHTFDEGEIMNVHYSPRARSFAAENAAVIDVALEACGAGRGGLEAEERVRRSLITLLEKTRTHPWVHHGREWLLARLRPKVALAFAPPTDALPELGPAPRPGAEGLEDAPPEPPLDPIEAAQLLLSMGDTATAWEIAEQLEVDRPDDVAAAVLRCELAAAHPERHADAESICDRAFARSKDDPAPPLRLAYLKIRHNQADEALPLLAEAERRLSAKNEDNIEIWAHIAALYRDTSALSAAERVLGKLSGHEEARVTGDWVSKVRQQYAVPQKLSESAEAGYVRTMTELEAAIRAEDLEAARRIAARLGAHEKRAAPLLCEGFGKSRNPQAARAWCKEALDDPRAEPTARLVLGFADLAAGRAGQAIRAFERVIELAPDRVEAWNLLHAAYRATGRTAEMTRLSARYEARFGEALR